MAEYIWEDFEKLTIEVCTSTDPNDPFIVQRREIIDRFKKHPEKLQDGGICKRMWYTTDEIKDILSGKRGHPFSF